MDFDISDENKEKLLALAGSDPESVNPAAADSLADTLDFPSSGRFGADTLSKQMRMYDVGLDLVNDPEIDQLVDQGVKIYFNERRRESFAIDLDDILKTGYKYPEGPGGFQLYLEGDPNWHEKMPPGFDLNDADFMTVDEPHLHVDIVNGIMDQIRFLIKIKFDATQSRDSNEFTYSNIELAKDFFEPGEMEVPPLGDKEQRILKLKKAYNLFKRRTLEDRMHFGPAVVQHIYDKAMQPMYEIFTETIYKHNPDIDMSQIKERKMKITRSQLKKIIREALETYDDDYKLTSRVDKPNQTFRRLPHELQQEPVRPESAMGTIDQSELDPETYFKIFSKASPLRKTTTQSGEKVFNPEGSKQADSIVDALTDVGTNPFGTLIDHEGTKHAVSLPPEEQRKAFGDYTDAKRSYDRAHSRTRPSGGYPGVEELDIHEVHNFSELGQYLEFNEHPVHGPHYDTILYKLYDDLASRDAVTGEYIDLLSGFNKLKEYVDDPEGIYAEDKKKIEPETMDFLKSVVHDMQQSLKGAFSFYSVTDDIE